MSAQSEILVASIITLLEGCHGFDGWWNDIDEWIKEDILDALNNCVLETLDA